ncbi:AAA family ATPase [Paenibacillus sp. FSL H8-0332]|uniref:AAA family ATPase n=1 Tax=Paenibacillus sp. FSL H8-0332 TaxID=2954742 RepID=UPI0030CD667E
MKKLVIVNGTMGVGKSTIVSKLYKELQHSVWLDGDWCWLMNPWKVTEENKTMVMNNIHYMLNQYLDNSMFEYVFFSWVLHKESIFDEILAGIKGKEYELIKVTLMCSEEELIKRMRQDERSESEIENSINRLANYKEMNTQKLNTNGKEIDVIIKELLHMIESELKKRAMKADIYIEKNSV